MFTILRQLFFFINSRLAFFYLYTRSAILESSMQNLKQAELSRLDLYLRRIVLELVWSYE